MSLASLYILVGTSGRFRPVGFVVGVALALITFGLAIWLATRPIPGRPRQPKLLWPMIGLALWYAALAAAAAFAGPEYAVAGLLAGVIPLAAMALMVAVIRRKTGVTEDGRLVDISADANEDALPGIGLDDHSTQLGDTPERADHPERADVQQRRFERSGDREHTRPRP
jgi:hypothetical protein